jgi:hypothetical protein
MKFLRLKMLNKSNLLIIAILLIFSSCSSPTNYNYNGEQPYQNPYGQNSYGSNQPYNPYQQPQQSYGGYYYQQPNSRAYSNPYNITPANRGYSDSDQYYKQPNNYNTSEGSSKYEAPEGLNF